MKILYQVDSKRKITTEKILDPFIGKDAWVRIAEPNYHGGGAPISYSYIKVIRKTVDRLFDFMDPEPLYVCDAVDWPTYEHIRKDPLGAKDDILHGVRLAVDSFGVVLPVDCYSTEELFGGT